MRSRRVLSEECVRACEWASLRLDSELSEIEELLLQAHLARCCDCRSFTESVIEATEALRATPLEEPTYAFELPRKRSARVVGLRAVSAVAAAAVVGLTGLVSFQLSTSRAPSVAAAADQRLIGLKEEQMEELDAVGQIPVRKVSRGLAAAERVTVGRTVTTRHRRPAVPPSRLPVNG
jgi:ferric-dicitrate binding protein FerR (iron transport regulator)